MPIDAKASEILSRGWYKEPLSPQECCYLLTFTDRSPVASLTVSLANRLTHKLCSDVGQICAEITVSSGPCSGNCGFCRFAEETSSARFFDIEDGVLARYAEEIGGFSDVRNICLTTCADANIGVLCDQIRTVREHARRGTRIFVNTRDLSASECARLKDSGAYGAYHSCRIGEGKDTGFKKERRFETMDNIVSGGLQLVSGVEPIGPETDPKDIVEQFFEVLDRKCLNCLVTGREPVPGTKFNQFGKMSPSRLAQIRSVLTLASSWYDTPVKNAFPGTFIPGQNLITVHYDAKAGKDQIEAARRKLFNNGFARVLKTDDSTAELSLMYLKQTGSV